PVGESPAEPTLANSWRPHDRRPSRTQACGQSFEDRYLLRPSDQGAGRRRFSLATRGGGISDERWLGDVVEEDPFFQGRRFWQGRHPQLFVEDPDEILVLTQRRGPVSGPYQSGHQLTVSGLIQGRHRHSLTGDVDGPCEVTPRRDRVCQPG